MLRARTREIAEAGICGTLLGVDLRAEFHDFTTHLAVGDLLAFWTDSTRIATFMLGDAQSSQDYSWLPGVKARATASTASASSAPRRAWWVAGSCWRGPRPCPGRVS